MQTTDEILEVPALRIIHDQGESPDSALRAYHRGLLPTRDRSRSAVPPVVDGLQKKCLEITSSFEGVHGFASIAGDFDKQGISLGALQQCLGQGSLQPLLTEMIEKHGNVLVGLWGKEPYQELDALLKKTRRAQVAWGRSISKPPRRYHVLDPWRSRLQAMARTPEYIALQLTASDRVFNRALKICMDWDLTSQRAVAFAFDTCTQQGGIHRRHQARIKSFLDAKQAKLGRELTEVERMLCITQGRTSHSIPRWQADVLSRRYAIILGRSLPFTWRGRSYSGKVHGSDRHIDREFGLSDAPWKAGAPPTKPAKKTSKKAVCPSCGHEFN